MTEKEYSNLVSYAQSLMFKYRIKSAVTEAGDIVSEAFSIDQTAPIEKIKSAINSLVLSLRNTSKNILVSEIKFANKFVCNEFQCNKCLEIKTEAEFYFVTRHKTGQRSMLYPCKHCICKRNRDKIALRGKRTGGKRRKLFLNEERQNIIRERAKNWNKNNPERAFQNKKNWLKRKKEDKDKMQWLNK